MPLCSVCVWVLLLLSCMAVSSLLPKMFSFRHISYYMRMHVLLYNVYVYLNILYASTCTGWVLQMTIKWYRRWRKKIRICNTLNAILLAIHIRVVQYWYIPHISYCSEILIFPAKLASIVFTMQTINKDISTVHTWNEYFSSNTDQEWLWQLATVGAPIFKGLHLLRV